MRLQNQDGLNSKDYEYMRQFKERHYGQHKKCPTALAWNPDGTLLATAEQFLKTWHCFESGLEKSPH